MILNVFSAIHGNFRLKLILSIGFVLLVALSLYFFFVTQQLSRTLREGLIEHGKSTAENIGFSAELGVLAGDPVFVEAATVGIFQRKEVVFIAVYNKEGKVIASQGTLFDLRQFPSLIQERLLAENETIEQEISVEGESYYDFFAPIIIRTTGIPGSGEAVGFTRVTISLEEIQEKQRQLLFFYFLVSFLIFLGAGVACVYFARRITSSVDELMEGVKNVAEGRYDVRVNVGAKDEFGRLAVAFNKMTGRLQDVKERDEQVSRMKSEFLSIAAHQLRTPLSASKWVLRMILDGDVGSLKKPQKELLEKGYLVNERMITLVNDLLDIVRIEEGRFDYAFKKGAVSGIIEDVIKETRAVVDKKNVQLTFHKPVHELPEVALDAQKFRLAVSNIIDNAVRYTKADGRVDIELTFHDDEILVIVKDTGIGIPKRWLDRLFTKFFRADNAIKMQTDGSGLGLFIAKNIIEKHGGRIWLESEEGKGTTAYFTIPTKENTPRANRGH